MYVYLCTVGMWCQRADEGTGSLGNGVITWVLGIELGSSRRVMSAESSQSFTVFYCYYAG